jgi:RNA polymerase sigma-70 factor (ECF subfamily)
MTEGWLRVDQLIDQIRRGDAEAQGRLLEHYRPYLHLLAEQAIGPTIRKRSDASDVVQQTFLDACRDLQTFRGSTEAEFSAWIKRILARNVSNLVRDQRAAKRDVTRDQPLYHQDGSASLVWYQPAADGPSPSQLLMQGEAAIRLAAVLVSLPADQREAVRLRHLEGWSLIQIAQHMDRTTTAAAGLIKRGLQTLRKQMADESWI